MKLNKVAKLQVASCNIGLKYTRSEAFSTRGKIKNKNTVHSALIAENRITNRWVIAGNPEITPQLILRRRLMLRFLHRIASRATPRSRYQHTAVTAGAGYVGGSIHSCKYTTSILLYVRTYQYQVGVVAPSTVPGEACKYT